MSKGSKRTSIYEQNIPEYLLRPDSATVFDFSLGKHTLNGSVQWQCWVAEGVLVVLNTAASKVRPSKSGSGAQNTKIICTVGRHVITGDGVIIFFVIGQSFASPADTAVKPHTNVRVSDHVPPHEPAVSRPQKKRGTLMPA